MPNMKDSTSLNPDSTIGGTSYMDKLPEDEHMISNDETDTPLHMAVRRREASLVNHLLKSGFDVNTINTVGNTALHVAAVCGDAVAMNILLTFDADVNRINSDNNTPLHLAVTHGDMSLVTQLLNSYARVNVVNRTGNTPLHIAASLGETSTVKSLLDFDADVNMKNDLGETALHQSVYKGNKPTVKLLLTAGTVVNMKNIQGSTALHIAVSLDWVDIVEMLLNFGANVNVLNSDGNAPLHQALSILKTSTVDLIISFEADVNLVNDKGNTPLHLAVRFKDASTVELLLKNGANVKKKDRDGNTPLHLAASGKTSIVKLLLSAGASVNTTNKIRSTPLHLAARHGKELNIKLLLTFGANPDIKGHKTDDTPLHLASCFGHTFSVDLLLTYKANVDVKNSDSETALYLAAYYGKLDIVYRLIKCGADVNIISAKHNETPLLAAVRHGKYSIVNLLLLFGADVNAMNEFGETSLYLAVKNGMTSIIKRLLKKRAHINTPSKQGKTPLHLAVNNEKVYLVKLLLQSGATVNAINSLGETPLHLAVRQGKGQIINLLLKFGAKLTITTKSGDTPLDIAVKYQKIEVVKLLLEYGVHVNNLNSLGRPALFKAITCQNLPIVELLLKFGITIQAKDNVTRNQILHLNVHLENTYMLKLMSNSNASFNSRNHVSYTQPCIPAGYNKEITNCQNTTFTHNKLLNLIGLSLAPQNRYNDGLRCITKKVEVNFADSILSSSNDEMKFSSNDIFLKSNLMNTFQLNALLQIDDLIKTAYNAHEPSYVVSHILVQTLEYIWLCYRIERIENQKLPVLLNNRTDEENVIMVIVRLGAGNFNFWEFSNYNRKNCANITFLNKWSNNSDNMNIINCRSSVPCSVPSTIHLKFDNRWATLEAGCKRICSHLVIQHEKILSVKHSPGFNRLVKNKNDVSNAPLKNAFAHEVTPIVQSLDVNKKISVGMTLHQAVYKEETQIVRRLLVSGTEVNTRNNNRYTALHIAVGLEKITIAELLLNFGSDVNTVNGDGNAPLHQAAYTKNVSLMNLLLNYNATTNFVNKDGNTPLHIATRYGDASTVELLLKHGAKVNLKNNEGFTPLHIASQYGIKAVINLLRSFGADVNMQCNKFRETPLHLATRFGEALSVDLLQKFGADVNITNNHGESPLYLAVCYGKTAIVDRLLQCGAHVNAVSTKRQEMPLHVAARRGTKSIMNSLLKSSEDINKTNTFGETALFLASKKGFSSIIKELLMKGADVNTAAKRYETPLHAAAYHGDPSAVELLLKSGAIVNATNNLGETPLHHVACYGKGRTVELLLKFGANMNLMSKSGKMPLHLAVIYQNIEMVKLLLKYGVYVNSLNGLGSAPLHLAVKYQNTLIVEILLKFGAQVDNIDDFNGNTSLHLAVLSENILIVDLLLKFGASVNLKNNTGDTPLHLAVRCKNINFVKMLLSGGADFTLKNTDFETPISIAQAIKHESNNDIVSLLENSKKYIMTNNLSQNSNRHKVFKAVSNQVISGNISLYNKVSEFKYLKRVGTSGMSGQLYDTKLLCLVLIKALNDKKIEHFTLGTKIKNIGDMDDICFRFKVKGHEKPIIIFLRTNHKESEATEAGAAGNFIICKYVQSYLKIMDRFHPRNDDLMFDGDFNDFECKLIVYTPLKVMFDKKYIKIRPPTSLDSILNTTDNVKPFKHMCEENEVIFLTEIIVNEQIKKLGATFLKYVLSEDDTMDTILKNELISRYHVAMRREVLQHSETQSKFRLWEFRPEFFKSNNKYLVALRHVFVNELSTKYYNRSKITKKDIAYLISAVKDTCSCTISKLLGKLATYNKKKKKLEFYKALAYEESLNIHQSQNIMTQLEKIVIHENVINEAVLIKLSELKIKLPLEFGNLDMVFHGTKLQVQNEINFLATKVKNLIEVNKNSNIIIINNDAKCTINKNIKDINIGLVSAIGNLLVLDEKKKLLKLEMDKKLLPQNAILFLEELERLDIKSRRYYFRTEIKSFPKYSFDYDEYDAQTAKRFFDILWFYTNQAKENELECILIDLINKYYNNTNTSLFKIHSNAIFLRSHDEILKWWMRKGETVYLNQSNDIFLHAKQLCVDNLFLTVTDYMQHMDIFKINLKFEQNTTKLNTRAGIVSSTLDNFHDLMDIKNKLIKVWHKGQVQIVNQVNNFELSLKCNNELPNVRQPFCNNFNSNGPVIISNNGLQNIIQSKYKYQKKNYTTGVSGQLYETKLLCLIHIRLLSDAQIEHFLLGTNMRNIGDMDDICLRYHMPSYGKPIVLFIQAKHKDDPAKGDLTVKDLRNSSGDFSLLKYFDSYLRIKEQFETNNDNPLFTGNFKNVDCILIIYTPARTSSIERKPQRILSPKVDNLISTGSQTDYFQYDYNDDDINFLSKMIIYERIKKFGMYFIEILFSDKIRTDIILVDMLIARYHVVMRRKVLKICKKQLINNQYCIWKIRPEFFKSNCKYLVALHRTFIKEISTKRCDRSKITEKDWEYVNKALQEPCPCTISKLIGKIATYNTKSRTLQLVEITNLKDKLQQRKIQKTQEELNKLTIDETVISEAVQIKLSDLNIKLPLAFGNLDLTFRGNEAKVIKRIQFLAEKLSTLFEMNKDTKIIELNDNIIGPGKIIEKGIIDVNGGIGGAVGNLLILDIEKKMLKFDLTNNELPPNATLFLKELRNDRYKSWNKDLGDFRIKISTDGFPKYSFDGDEYDKIQAKDFLNKLWFFTSQAKEDEVEDILKNEISKYFNSDIVNHQQRNVSDVIYLNSHNETQKWWMQLHKSPYLSRVSELFERAEEADIDNLLLTVINYMYVSGIYRIDIDVKQSITEYSKIYQIHQTFNKLCRRLFKIFDPESDKPVDIKFPEVLNSDSGLLLTDLVFCLEIQPNVQWVALKLAAYCSSSHYCVFAKAGPGNESRRAKDSFSVHQLLNDSYSDSEYLLKALLHENIRF